MNQHGDETAGAASRVHIELHGEQPTTVLGSGTIALLASSGAVMSTSARPAEPDESVLGKVAQANQAFRICPFGDES